MRGSQLDVLGFTVQRARPQDNPVNKFVTIDNMLGFVDVACSVNHKERLSSQRNVPLQVVNRAQGPLVTLQNQHEQVFMNGGLVVIPDAGLWKRS